MRKGMGKNKGMGYKNLTGKDPRVHSDSARGRKQPQKLMSVTKFRQTFNIKKANDASKEFVRMTDKDEAYSYDNFSYFTRLFPLFKFKIIDEDYHSGDMFLEGKMGAGFSHANRIQVNKLIEDNPALKKEFIKLEKDYINKFNKQEEEDRIIIIRGKTRDSLLIHLKDFPKKHPEKFNKLITKLKNR